MFRTCFRKSSPKMESRSLLSRPLCGGVGGNAEMHHPPAVVRQNQEPIQDLKPDGGHREDLARKTWKRGNRR